MDKFINPQYSLMDNEDSFADQKTPEQKKQYILSEINLLLNDFSNEIPKEVIHGPREEGQKQYKVRVGWFTGVFGILNFIWNTFPECFPEEFKSEVTKFRSDFRINHPGYKVKNDPPTTTKEEIDKADDLLKRGKEFIEALK